MAFLFFPFHYADAPREGKRDSLLKEGLVWRDHIRFVHEAYELYRLNEDVEGELGLPFRSTHGDRMPIKFIACFEAFGSLRLPFNTSSFLGCFSCERYQSQSSKLSPFVEHAIRMLAMNEDRSTFSPTVTEKNKRVEPGQLTQLRFCGRGTAQSVQEI